MSLIESPNQIAVTFDTETIQVSTAQPTFQSAAAGFASVVKLVQPKGGHVSLVINREIPWLLPADQRNVLSLDGVHDQITPGGWVVIERLDTTTEELKLQVRRVVSVATLALANYGVSAKVTQLKLDNPWLDEKDTTLAAIRNAAIYAQSESLKLSEAPYDADILKNNDVIDLDGLYDGLKSGRWVIISGERTDIPATSGVFASELAMVQSVKQDIVRIPSQDGDTFIDLPGDKLHSYLVLSQKLAYSYKRASVTLYGNVVKATHGETRQEVLGSGDGSLTLQHFTLKQTPLTYLSSPTPRGAENTLQVRVNEVLWHEVSSLVGLGRKDRKYVTQTDDNAHVSVIFGNGEQGARLPTGQENVKATYRSGTGSSGNAKAQQISLLSTRPLGVKAVINPLAASGGADREDRDQARRNAPRSVTSLDRLVSVRDYEDFARTFAGIAKASALRYFDDQQREAVYLTVAGTDDIPIDETSDLLNNLRLAFRQSGDPFLPVEVHRRELITVVLSAEIRRDPDYLWDDVAARIRTSLLTAFGFNNRDLATDLWLSEVVAVIQNVPGVEYVNVKAFVGVPELRQDGKSIITPDEIRTTILNSLPASQPSSKGNATLPQASIIAKPARFECQATRPAQLAMMLPNVPDTLILKEVAQ